MPVLLVVSCGSRGPLDDTPLITPTPEASTSADVATELPPPTGSSGSDAGGIIACGQCLFGTCGPALQSCLESEACRAVFQCVTTDCIPDGGGSPSQSCILKCAGADPQGALQVFALFQCVTGECGTKCEDLLSGGLGGLGPGGQRDGG